MNLHLVHTSIRILCSIASGAALLGAAAYLMRGPDKALGVLLVLVAVIICRVLMLNIALPLERSRAVDQAPAEPGTSTDSAEESAR